MGRPRWEMTGNEMGKRNYPIIWDFQEKRWQIMRWEDEFTTGNEMSKMGINK